MKQTRIIMGMPITVDIVGEVEDALFSKVFDYFNAVDAKFSTYKTTSEVSFINRGEIKPEEHSDEMKEILFLSKKTNYETNGYFDIFQDGKIDPSGLVKGWAILNAANILREEGFENFYIDAGADIEIMGKNSEDKPWRVGIRNPLSPREIIKSLQISDRGVATSGIYERGKHIYNPKTHSFETDLASMTVIGPDVFEADRFATAAFAMGRDGINFIEKQKDLEGYMIDKNGIATFTTGFEKYVQS